MCWRRPYMVRTEDGMHRAESLLLGDGSPLMSVQQTHDDPSAEVCNFSFLLCQTFEVSMCPPLCSSAAMKLDDEVLTLNATAQLVHGVELSKDQTGVTAKMTTSNHTVTVLFDGYTTIIHATGQKYQVEGHPACGFHLVLLLVESDSTGQQDCIKIICI